MRGHTMTEAADKIRRIGPANGSHWEVVAEANE